MASNKITKKDLNEMAVRSMAEQCLSLIHI